MAFDPKQMVKLYDWSIDQWLEDSPLTTHQKLILEHGCESLEEMLRTDLERLQYWRLMQANNDT